MGIKRENASLGLISNRLIFSRKFFSLIFLSLFLRSWICSEFDENMSAYTNGKHYYLLYKCWLWKTDIKNFIKYWISSFKHEFNKEKDYNLSCPHCWVIFIKCLWFPSMDIKNNHSLFQFKCYASVYSGLIRGKPTVPMRPQLHGKMHYRVTMS